MTDTNAARELLQEAMTALVEGEYHEQVDAYEKIRVFLSSSESKKRTPEKGMLDMDGISDDPYVDPFLAAPEAAAQVGGDNSPASTHENARLPDGSPAAAAPELSEKQIEAWRGWLTTGLMTPLYCGTADQLCDMALRSLRGKEIAR